MADISTGFNDAAPLAIGQELRTDSETTGDLDVFALQLTGGTSYQFAVRPYPENYRVWTTGELALYNSAQTRLKAVMQGGANGEPIMAFTPAESGTYYLTTNAYQGLYTVSAKLGPADDFREDRASATITQMGKPITGVLEAPNDIDWHSVSLAADVFYHLTVPSTVRVNIRDAAGTLVGGSDGMSVLPGGELGFSLAKGGTYTMEVLGALPGNTGAYTIQTLAMPDDYTASTATTGRLLPGGAITARSETYNDVDWFAIALEQGGHYQFRIDGQVPMDQQNGPKLEILDAAGRRVGEVTSRSPDFVPSASGTYYLAAAGKPFSAYTLSAGQHLDDNLTREAAKTLAIGASTRGDFDYVGDNDWFKLSLEEGMVYQLEIDSNLAQSDSWTSAEQHPKVAVYRDGVWADFPIDLRPPVVTPQGTVTVSFRAPETTTYAARVSAPVRDLAQGTKESYVLTARPAPVDDVGDSPLDAAALAVGEVRAAQLETLDDIDMFRAQLTAGVKYRVTLGGDLGELADNRHPIIETGSKLEAPRDYRGDLLFHAMYTGEHFITVRPFTPVSGKYTIGLVPVRDDHGGTVASAVPMELGSGAWGELENAADHDMFSIKLEAGIAYRFDATSSAVLDLRAAAATMRLLDPQGREVAAGVIPNGQGVTYKPLVGGVYHVDMGGSMAAPSFYQIVPQQLTPDRNGVKGGMLVQGTEGPDTLRGGVSGDRLIGKGGNDVLYGDNGTDTAVIAGPRAQYVTVSRDGKTVIFGPDATDELRGIERVEFTDMTMTFGQEGIDGQAYRMYRAVFDRVPDKAGLGYWIDAMENGMTLPVIAPLFAASDEFRATYGGYPSNLDLVKRLYQNVLHREGEQAGIDFWVDVLDRKAVSVPDVLVAFSESQENVNATAQLIGNGFEWIPYG